MPEKKAFISCGLRTPIGSFQGSLKNLSAPQLASEVIKQIILKHDIEKNTIDSVILGSVVTSGLGQSPAKQASLLSGLGDNIPCSTVNKVCGSGLYSVLLGVNDIKLGQANAIVAGGMESMSNIPYLLRNIRSGLRFGDNTIIDGMLHDGLIDPYSGKHMGEFGELCANKWKISREKQDLFSKESYLNALLAQEKGLFQNEISPLHIENRKKTISIYNDEEPKKFNADKIAKLKPAFAKEGSVTAFNASKLSDGAAALIVSNEQFLKDKNLGSYFEVIGLDTFSHAPEWFTTAPTQSIKRVLKNNSLSVSDIGLFEINEAFSVVPIHAMEELNINREHLNVNGGAISLGHPLGCSGSRILVTLMNAMINKNIEIGCASICLGGGEAISILIKQIF
jgi:acetyl-CoA C-acetyltransferase